MCARLHKAQTMTHPAYEVFAVKYAERDGTRSDHFMGGDPHDAPMPMAYYVWLIRNRERQLLVDTGFHLELAARRNRRYLRAPTDALALLDVDSQKISEVVITHMHNDHAGGILDYPNATFHMQDVEMAYVTGRQMRHEFLRRSFVAEHVVSMVRKVFEDRVAFHDGDDEIAPGIVSTESAVTPRGCSAYV